MISELFLVHHLFLYEASERGLGDVIRRKGPQSPFLWGTHNLLLQTCCEQPFLQWLCLRNMDF